MTRVVDVGTPSSNFEDWTTTNVRFHGFADLSTTARDEPVESPEFSCFGHQWELDIYPGGYEKSNDGYVAVFLSNMTAEAIKIQYGLSVRDAAGKEVVYYEPATREFGAVDGPNGRGNVNFAKLSLIMDSLVEGALMIEVRMRLKAIEVHKQFIPKNPIIDNILNNKFHDEESADIVFEVGSGSKLGKGTRKRAKTSTTSYYAHRFIVQDISTTLAEMCKPSAGDEATTSVSITDVKPDVFQHMLYYIYGGDLPDELIKEDAKDLIDAADKYGVVSLKLEAEVYYVKSTTITLENMMDNLLYAESKNLAVLKEAVMDYMVANKSDIIGKVSFDNVPSSMITDILAAVARGEQSGDDNNNDTIDYNKMRVGTLRKMLDEKGLDVDGSREAMIALLKENA